jgi:site-specific recombinase XerD
MFDLLFGSPQTLSRHATAPLALDRANYLAKLASSGYSRHTLIDAAEYLLVVIEYLDLGRVPRNCVGPEEIAAAADLWASQGRRLRGMRHPSRAKMRFKSHATRFLAACNKLSASNVIPARFDPHIAEFALYMEQERGLSASTISARCAAVRQLLSEVIGESSSLELVKIADIDKAMSKYANERRYARITIQTLASSLRAFFRFAESHEWCAHGLAEAIMAPRVFQFETLPAGPSWEQVRILLSKVASDRPVDLRDKAILLLLSVYGLRAGEVCHLQLQDLDWEKEILNVTRSKRLGVHQYPLTRLVGDAVIRYLKEVRPRSPHREVFLTLNAPYRPLSASALYPVVGKRLRPIAENCRHHGPHALRHACATHLLNEGHTLKEVGDHLGHRNADTTRIYAKVNLTGLRTVAEFDLGGLL